MSSNNHDRNDWPERITRAVGSPASVFIHTLLFAAALMLPFFGVDFDRVLLFLTTIVSLEAIYLSLFIQISVNRNTQSLAVVEDDIEEIQEDIDEITEDIEEIAVDVDEIQEDVEEITEDIEEIADDVEDIAEDVEEITEEKNTPKKEDSAPTEPDR